MTTIQFNLEPFYTTHLGAIYLGDSLELIRKMPEQSVDLIMTSPPFGLVRKKEYGNVDAPDYLDWFRPFGELFKRVLKPNGSLVIDIGGAWIKGLPTRSLYHFKLVIMLVEELGFHLAQEFYWWNPSKLPTPAEWVTVRRIRVKDAVNTIWWLSPTAYPQASNRRVLQPYSDSMEELLEKGYQAKKRPSGHNISSKFSRRNRGAIPPNLIALANTESNSFYLRYCNDRGIKPHPARFPSGIPEYFIRMLTEPGDIVLDPFAGSCVTGEVAEAMNRRWICIDLDKDYLTGALGRFRSDNSVNGNGYDPDSEDAYYKIPRPGLLWEETEYESLPTDGGKARPTKRSEYDFEAVENTPGMKEAAIIASRMTSTGQLRLLQPSDSYAESTDDQNNGNPVESHADSEN